MRRIRDIAATQEKLFAICEDGTLWERKRGVGANSDRWEYIEGPPEGEVGRKPMTDEEIAERLRKKSRGLIIGKGLKDE